MGFPCHRLRAARFIARPALRGVISALLILGAADFAAAEADPSAGATPGAAAPPLVLNRTTFAPLEGAWWKLADMEDVIEFFVSDVYAAGPRPDQDRDAWVAAMREYRELRRRGELEPGKGRYREVIALDFTGDNRAWTRLADSASRAYALASGDQVTVDVEARWIRGNNNLCVAFDYVNEADGAWAWWSGVLVTLTIPQDGAWHKLSAVVEVPAADLTGRFVRPIVGMDAAHDTTPGIVEIREIDFRLDDPDRMRAIRGQIIDPPVQPIDQTTYTHPARDWLKGGFTCHFTFMYDLSFYNPEAGEYELDSFLADGEREFGGYDILLLWHAYPRIGLDPRNQLDFYRDMPGGMAGLRELVDRLHERGVRVFINYNPWDVSTQREGKSDEEMLAELVAELDVDGIFLDTMTGDSPELRRRVEAVRPGIVLAPESSPTIDNLSICSASWAQWLDDDENPPGLEVRKWLQPRHMRWQTRRTSLSHREEIRRAFFNGSGMLVWENIFGAWNRWSARDRQLWRRAAAILHHFQDNFASDEWDPFYPATEVARDAHQISINRWPGRDATVFTLYRKDDPDLDLMRSGLTLPAGLEELPLFSVADEPEMEYFDLWNGRPARIERGGERVTVYGALDKLTGLGCIAAVRREAVDAAFRALLEKQLNEADRLSVAEDARGGIKSVVLPRPVEPIRPVDASQPPEGMVAVPGGEVHLRITHQRRECGCYPDPDIPASRYKRFTIGTPHNGQIEHDYTEKVAPFWIDEAAVTNAQFKEFLDQTGYRPRHPENFLKHWPNGEMPPELADHPVVYVDLNDARAYAQWAGKRLPTEAEWHLAAQGTDGRKWPWGNEFDEQNPDPTLVNTTGATLPARSLPAGRSPYGCYQMSGNVYEWTESERDDGHTRFCIIRGGSYYKATGSDWYMDGGPRPCDHHAKFIMMWPGLDRCATIGFRCVTEMRRR